MMRATIAVLLALVALLSLAGPARADAIANASFETDAAWTAGIADPDGKYSAYYTTSWASEGLRSFVLHRGTGTVTAGAYAQISQTGVNLTGATKLIFDCQDTGIDVVPLRFIVDDVNIVGTWQNNGWPGGQGSDWGHTAVTTGIEIPLGAAYPGLHKLTIQMWNPASHWPADPKIYCIDNLRTDVVPEPSSLCALAMGLPALLVRRRKR
ncbi:MAG: PEP-CTERM sorting domain-containing protein [Armatimonadetes bacterium]|nr:PEP-CTERM sorting domain-containing protein [Armatimonadota bacterium]